MHSMNDTIFINSVVSERDFRPFVQLKWGENSCQMTPNESRQHAYNILLAAEAAESDSAMVNFLKEKVGLDEKSNIAAILSDFRRFREIFEIREGQNRLGK